MKRSTLREFVRAHYRSASLPRETLAQWLAEEGARTSDAASAPAAPVHRRWGVAVAIAVGIAALAALAFLGIGRRARAPRGPELARAIAAEVAANHAKLRPLDVEAATFVELRRGLDRLDFTLAEPRSPFCDDLVLVGARYCSIQGRPAAQIRLRDGRGEPFTLYEVCDQASFADLADTELVVDGSIVRIWRADGLLFALATAAS